MTFPVKKRSIDGAMLAYRAAGNLAARPIMLIHGLTGSSADWESTAGALAPAGWRVIAPDCPGHGDSFAPTEPGDYELGRVADLLHRLAAELAQVPAIMVGNSMGGAIAQEYAIKHGHDVSALVLVDSAGDMRRPIARPAGHQEFVEREFKTGLEGGMEAIWELHQEARGWMYAGDLRPDFRERMKARICRTSAYGYLYSDRALGNRRKTLANLAPLKMPTLVMCCEHEGAMLKQVSEDLASAIPGARSETIPDAWHQPQLENPAAFNEILLRFLGTL